MSLVGVVITFGFVQYESPTLFSNCFFQGLLSFTGIGLYYCAAVVRVRCPRPVYTVVSGVELECRWVEFELWMPRAHGPCNLENSSQMSVYHNQVLRGAPGAVLVFERLVASARKLEMRSVPIHLALACLAVLFLQVYRNYMVLIRHSVTMWHPVIQILILQAPIWVAATALLLPSVTRMDYAVNR